MSFNFEMSEEMRQVQQTAQQVARNLESIAPKMREEAHNEKKFPEPLWQAVAEAGFLGALMDEEYGGSNMGLSAMGLALETLASNRLGNVFMVVTPMSALTIQRQGSPELKKRLLPGIAEGRIKFCFAITEPEAGSNSFRITTHAKRERDEFVINGQKTFITGVDQADYIMLVTRTTPFKDLAKGSNKAHGFSLFVVPTDAPGMEKHVLPTQGIEGMNQFTLFFNDMRIPAENLVGQEDGGSLGLFEALNPERILAACSSGGITDYLLKRAVEYANQRAIFGDKPIGSYQGIQHPLAEIKAERECARLMTYKAAWAYDTKQPQSEVAVYANIAKLQASEIAIKASDRALQTFGGNGFSSETGMINIYTNVRLSRTAPVSREMVLSFIGEHVLGMPRSY